MSDKTSQSTEEEMLDQTFGGYDEEMTSRTEDPNTAPQSETAKKKSNNAVIFTVAGVAAAGVIGYMFFGGNNPPVQTQPPVTQAVTPVEPVVVQPVQQQTPVTPATTTPDGNFLEGQSSDQNPLAGTQGTVNTNGEVDAANIQPTTVTNTSTTATGSTTVDTTIVPSANTSVASTQGVVTPVGTTTTVTTSVPTNNTATISPVVNEPVVAPVTSTVSVTPTNTSVAGNNLAQQSLVNELKQLFDQQTKEIRTSVDGMGNRIGDLEKANKSIEERLANLEAGKPTVVAKPVITKAPVKAKKVVRKAVKVIKSKTEQNHRDVLIDKSSSTTTTTVTAKPADIQIHSIYAGRVWTKNKDGSLSTFSSGDTLPSGEVIKRVDEEKGQIVTSKRVIN